MSGLVGWHFLPHSPTPLFVSFCVCGREKIKMAKTFKSSRGQVVPEWNIRTNGLSSILGLVSGNDPSGSFFFSLVPHRSGFWRGQLLSYGIVKKDILKPYLSV